MPTIHRDNVGLYYEEAGSGSPPIVLLHALGCDHTAMSAQFEHFRKTHRVINLDLRGFGRSDKPAGDYSVESYADDVAWLCRALQLDKPILVGHSLGGSVTLATAARHPELASAAVLLEAFVVAPAALLGAFDEVLEALSTDAYPEVARQFSDQLVGPRFDPRDRERARELMAGNPQAVVVSALRHVLGFDSDAAAAACRIPVLYVSSGPWYTDVARFRSLCPQLVTAQLVGCGHHFPYEVPDQTNAVLARFIATLDR